MLIDSGTAGFRGHGRPLAWKMLTFDWHIESNHCCPCKQGDADADHDRLNEVYERMRVVGASTAEARASKILHGLGFTEVMQKRATQMFRWAGWGGQCSSLPLLLRTLPRGSSHLPQS